MQFKNKFSFITYFLNVNRNHKKIFFEILFVSFGFVNLCRSFFICRTFLECVRLEGGFLRLGETVAVKSLMSCEEEEKRQQHQPQNRPQQQIQPEEVKTKTERSKSAFVLIVRQRQCLKERQRREETKEKKERKTMENATTAFNLKSCWHSINP